MSVIGKQFGTLNSSIMVSIVASTTGADPDRDDLIELAIIPMVDCVRDVRKRMLDCLIKPVNSRSWTSSEITKNYPDTHVRARPNIYARAAAFGVADELFTEAFDNWYSSLGLPDNARLTPLCFDWAHISRHMSRLLGPTTIHKCFDYRARDLCAIMAWENDVATTFRLSPRVNLVKRTTLFELHPDVDVVKTETALSLANYQIELYARLLAKREVWTAYK